MWAQVELRQRRRGRRLLEGLLGELLLLKVLLVLITLAVAILLLGVL